MPVSAGVMDWVVGDTNASSPGAAGARAIAFPFTTALRAAPATPVEGFAASRQVCTSAWNARSGIGFWLGSPRTTTPGRGVSAAGAWLDSPANAKTNRALLSHRRERCKTKVGMDKTGTKGEQTWYAAIVAQSTAIEEQSGTEIDSRYHVLRVRTYLVKSDSSVLLRTP
jgi:hypothetical protein